MSKSILPSRPPPSIITPMDKGTIIARALAKLGNRQYQTAAGTQDPAEQHFADVLLECNAAEDWSFCRAKTSIERSQSGIYPIPVDCLRITRVSTADDRDMLPHGFELCNGHLEARDYTDPITLRYIRRLLPHSGGTPDTPQFNNYIIALLAARIAPQIIGGAEGQQLADKYTQEAELARSRAIYHDRAQDRANDQRPRIGKHYQPY